MNENIKGKPLPTMGEEAVSFHDAEVMRISMTRDAQRGGGVEVEIDCVVLDPTGEVDEDGTWISRQYFVSLRFRDVNEIELAGFNRQNVLNELKVEERVGGEVAVRLDGTYGVSMSFRCKETLVATLERWNG